jgi:hypothetical protein
MITRVPVLIVTGIPLFGPRLCDIILRHVETRCYDGGLVRSNTRWRCTGVGQGLSETTS